jgi:tetratricopeptide (TPR) repeat protein
MKNLTKNSSYYLAALVALATFLAYLPALQDGFVEWDDNVYILDNPFIRVFDLHLVRWAFFGFHAGNWHPLTWLSHAGDYALWGLNPFGHHLTSIVIHAVNTGLVVLIVERLYKVATDQRQSIGRQHVPAGQPALITAGITGLLFGLHPVHVESVAWVAERKDLLSALFFLLSITAYVQAAGRVERGAKELGRGAEYTKLPLTALLPALCFFVLALLSKPMVVSLPVVLLILDWYPLQRIQSLTTLKKAVAEKFPFIALSLASSVVTILAQRSVGAVASFAAVPLSSRMLVAARSLMIYLWKEIVPLDLLPYYPYPAQVSAVSFEYLVPVVLIIGITGVCIALAGKHRVWLSFWCYHVVTLFPVLGIIQVGSQAMADRYTYLPSLGPFVMIGMLSSEIWRKTATVKHWRPVVRLSSTDVALSIMSVMTVLTIKQTGIWNSSFSLWNSVIENEPDIALAYNSRGVAFNRIGRVDAALRDFNRAIALNPTYYEAYYNRGIVFEKSGRLDRALQEYDEAIALNPLYQEAYFNRGMVFEKTGQRDEAIRNFKRVLALDPSNYEASINLGVLYAEAGKTDEALAYLNDAIGTYPAHPEGYFNRGMYYLSAGKNELAAEDFRKACDLGDAGGCEALHNLSGNKASRRQ